MILNNYRCAEHGIFEAAGPHCPHCGVACEKVYLKAPSVGHEVRKFTDAQVERLMSEFNLTDVPKQVDARERNIAVKHLRSSGQADPTPASKLSIDVGALGPDLAESSKIAGDAFRAIQGGGDLSPISQNAARYPRQGSRRVPISLAITDKR